MFPKAQPQNVWLFRQRRHHPTAPSADVAMSRCGIKLLHLEGRKARCRRARLLFLTRSDEPGGKTRPPICSGLSPSPTVVAAPEMSGSSPKGEACPCHMPKQFTSVGKKHSKELTNWQKY